MIRFNVNGKYLDLYAKTRVQFVRKNTLFAFDDIQLNRTAEFQVPATPTNNLVFAMANDAARYGTEARVRIAAQMQYSGGAEDGYLYISQSNRREYSVIFVYGELLDLKAIKEAGKISDIFLGVVPSGGNAPYCPQNMQATQANARDVDYEYGCLYYVSDNADAMDMWDFSGQGYTNLRPQPSYSLKRLTDRILNLSGSAVVLDRQDPTDDYSLYRLIQPQWRGADGEMKYQEAFNNLYYRWETLYGYNLPDMTLIDLLKTEAILRARALYYKEGVLSYDEVNLQSWNVERLEDIVAVGSIRRTFQEYAQHNRVEFDSEEWVEHPITFDYRIDNKNLEQDREIYTIPLNEGEEITMSDGDGNDYDLLLTHDVEGVGGTSAETPWEPVGTKHTIGYCGWVNAITLERTYMQPVRVPRMVWLDNLRVNSTMLEAQVLMPLYEFQALDEKKLLNLQGSLYVWTDAQWDDGVAQLTLSKVTI